MHSASTGRGSGAGRAGAHVIRVTLPAIAAAALLFALALAGGRSRAATAVPVTRDEPHMEMSVRLPPDPADAARGEAILQAARAVMARYPTVQAAEGAGFKKFAPGVQLPIEHYTNNAYALEAWFGRFDLEHPTSLIFKRANDGLHLVGVMYTASNAMSEADLNARVPLSLGTWHRHTNYCAPPRGTPLRESVPPNARFGFAGSIASKAACDAAGGTFRPVVFGWMVHVWPNERDPGKIWAVDADGAGHMHGDSAAGMVGVPRVYAGLPIPRDKLPSLAVPEGDLRAGAIVFAERCQSCHGIGARNGPDAPPLAGQGLAPGQVAFMVRNPKAIDPNSEMPKLPLSDGELADVAAFVASLK